MPITEAIDRRDRRMGELRESYQRAWLNARLQGDKALVEWEARRREICVVDDAREARVHRLIMRANLDDQGSSIGDDCHRVPDILRLVETAGASDGELHPLLQRQAFEEALAACLLEYEVSLAAYLAQRLAERRRMPTAREPQSISSQDPGWSEFQKRKSGQWGRRYDVSRQAADAIGILVRRYGGEVPANAWEARFREAFCPELMKDRLPEHLPEWLAARNDAAPEQLAAAEAWLAAWKNERDRLRQRAIDAGVRGKRQVQWLVSRQPPAINYANCLLDIHHAANDFVESFFALLTPDQRNALAPEIAGADPRKADNRLGPPIEPDALQGILMERP